MQSHRQLLETMPEQLFRRQLRSALDDNQHQHDRPSRLHVDPESKMSGNGHGRSASQEHLTHKVCTGVAADKCVRGALLRQLLSCVPVNCGLILLIAFIALRVFVQLSEAYLRNASQTDAMSANLGAVSYTHLTLPTIYSV